MKGIKTSGQAPNTGGVSSFSAPKDGVSHLAFPALAREKNHHDVSFPLSPLGNDRPNKPNQQLVADDYGIFLIFGNNRLIILCNVCALHCLHHLGMIEFQ